MVIFRNWYTILPTVWHQILVNSINIDLQQKKSITIKKSFVNFINKFSYIITCYCIVINWNYVAVMHYIFSSYIFIGYFFEEFFFVQLHVYIYYNYMYTNKFVILNWKLGPKHEIRWCLQITFYQAHETCNREHNSTHYIYRKIPFKLYVWKDVMKIPRCNILKILCWI